MKLSKKTLLASAALVLCAACGSDGGGKSSRVLASPDHAYVAILITEVDSGFAGSGCTNTVVVVPGTTALTENYPADSRAYAGNCHSLKMETINGQPVKPNGPQLKWTAPHELTIVFDPKLARTAESAFYSATSLYGGAVVIRNAPQ